MEAKDYITLTGIGITLFLGIVNLFIGINNSRKTIYINTVTRLRSEWLFRMKEYFSDYANCCYTIVNNRYTNFGEEIIALKLKTQIIKLNLNYLDNFDVAIILLLDNITRTLSKNRSTYDESKMMYIVDELFKYFQRITKFEWEGIKLESRKGKPTERQKKQLLKKYLYTQDVPDFDKLIKERNKTNA